MGLCASLLSGHCSLGESRPVQWWPAVSDRSLKGHEAGVRKGQLWAANHHPGIVAVYGLTDRPSLPDNYG